MATVTLGSGGGGITLCEAVGTDKRYIIGDIEILEEHSVAMMLRFYRRNEQDARIVYRFGLLPRFKTRVCFDLTLLDNRAIFTNRTPGTLKLVVHGQRTEFSDVDRIELGMEDAFHDVRLRFENFYLSDSEPEEYPIPDLILVDEFGQWARSEWPEKVHSLDELKEIMHAGEGEARYPFPHLNKWGGDLTRKLQHGTGFFTRVKTADGRWHLADPDGYDYFSLGPCCIYPGVQGRVDGFEKLCAGLPDENDPIYKDCWTVRTWRRMPYMPEETYKLFNFGLANLIKVYGENWYAKWDEITKRYLMGIGVNSEGNYFAKKQKGINQISGRVSLETGALPYVCQILGFPDTDVRIFRDFPDVLHPQYAERSEVFAEQLHDMRDDPWVIGYFMRNEPEFNFVHGIIIADEVLSGPLDTYCRNGLIEFLHNKYQTIEALNAAWDSDFTEFEDFAGQIRDCSVKYPASAPILREYSAFLVREYVRIPSEACRRADPHHMNLGMRWSKAYNPDMMAGWEYFDVFSINCYDFNPTRDMDFVLNAGVDRPVIIGEFHFGALDRGLPATGLKGVENQTERAKAFRYFVEQCAAHPLGVGAHWFQYADQSCIGRFDGENYQIGMVDVCLQPHKELSEAHYETAKVLYNVRNLETEPYNKKAKAIPMIGY